MGRKELQTQYSRDNSHRKGLSLRGLPQGQQDLLRTLEWRRKLEGAGCMETFVRRYCRPVIQPFTTCEVQPETQPKTRTVGMADLLKENVVVKLRSLQAV